MGVRCFFCRSRLTVIHPALPSSSSSAARTAGALAIGTATCFDCSVCGATNKRTPDGSPVDDDPAWRDPAINTLSFLKRAKPPSPPSLTVPTAAADSIGKDESGSVFCRDCRAHQALQINLLANYDPDDPDDLPPTEHEYRASLDSRYPLSCAKCEPKVHARLADAAYKARAAALGSRLALSKGSSTPAVSSSSSSSSSAPGWAMERTRANEELARRRRQVHFHFNDDDDDDELRTQRQQQWHKWTYQREWLKWTLGAVVWRLRGALWLASSLAPPLVQLIGSLDAAAGRPHALAALSIVPSRPGTHTRPARAWLALALLSLAWSFFDPLWLRARRHAARARPLRRRPATRRAWLALQLAQYLCRLALVGLLTLGSPHGDDNHNGGGGGGMGVGSLASSLSFASLLIFLLSAVVHAYELRTLAARPRVSLVAPRTRPSLSFIGNNNDGGGGGGTAQARPATTEQQRGAHDLDGVLERSALAPLAEMTISPTRHEFQPRSSAFQRQQQQQQQQRLRHRSARGGGAASSDSAQSTPPPGSPTAAATARGAKSSSRFGWPSWASFTGQNTSTRAVPEQHTSADSTMSRPPAPGALPHHAGAMPSGGAAADDDSMDIDQVDERDYDDDDDDADCAEDDSMDWTPSSSFARARLLKAQRDSPRGPSSSRSARHHHDVEFAPQRLWPPQQPTGLEALLADTLKVDGGEGQAQRDASTVGNSGRAWSRWLSWRS